MVHTVRTESMVLRPLRAGDESEWVRIHELSREYFRPWLPALDPDSRMSDVFANSLARSETGLRDGGEVHMVGLLDDGCMAGIFALIQITRHSLQGAHAGWRVSADQAGRGLATEGVAALLDLAFAPADAGLGLHRVQANILPSNQASLRIAEKVGFRLEGRAKAFAEVNGVREDHLMYAKTVDEHDLRYLCVG